MSAVEIEDDHAPNGPSREVGSVARLRSPVSDPRDITIPLRGGFELEGGGQLPDPHIRVRRHGRRNGPPVLVMGGISSGRKLAGPDGWWNDMLAPQAGIDLNAHSALGIDFAPIADERVPLSPHTQARLIVRALDELGIEKLYALVGASYGGMVGLALGALAPERVGALCIIAAAHQPTPIASAWRGVQRRIVEFGLEQDRGAEAMALARQLSMITYRTPQEFEERFHNLLGSDGRTDLDRYLIARGEAYREAMSPRRWLSLSEAIDRFTIAPETVQVPTSLVACPTDQIAPFADVTELAKRLPKFTALHALPSLYGHDAFLKEPERLGGIVEAFLRTTTP
jgi:homoserine O-acetyltransferase